jgi:hypothetical protein
MVFAYHNQMQTFYIQKLVLFNLFVFGKSSNLKTFVLATKLMNSTFNCVNKPPKKVAFTYFGFSVL